VYIITASLPALEQVRAKEHFAFNMFPGSSYSLDIFFGRSSYFYPPPVHIRLHLFLNIESMLTGTIVCEIHPQSLEKLTGGLIFPIPFL
jgi:hypothetical protein